MSLFSSLSSASPKSKQLGLLLILLFASSSSIMLGVPIMFKEPLIYCTPPSLTNPHICSEIEACSDNNIFFIDKINGPKSLTAEFGLICAKSSLKRFCITMSFFGFFIGCIVCTVVDVKANQRKFILSICSIGYAASLLLTLVFAEMLEVIAILLFLTSFFFCFVNAYVYVFITENFEGEFASAMMIMVNVGWALAGILLATLAYNVNSNWKIVLGTSGVLIGILAVMLFLMPYQKEYKEESTAKKTGIIESFREMRQNGQITINFSVYNLIWPFYIVCYSSVLVELESVGGSLYVNLILCSSFELIAAFVATWLTKFNGGEVLKWVLNLLSIFFISFAFAPLSLSQSSFETTIFFITMMLSGKFCYDILCLVVYVYLPKVMTDKYSSLFLIFSRFISRLMNMFVPYINLSMRSLGLHPFVFLGVVWLMSRFLINLTAEVQKEGMEVINEFKVSMVHKLSVVTGGKSIASILHDDILKNVQVKGSNLSVIRKSRFCTHSVMVDGPGLEEEFIKSNSMKALKEKYMMEMKNF